MRQHLNSGIVARFSSSILGKKVYSINGPAFVVVVKFELIHTCLTHWQKKTKITIDIDSRGSVYIFICQTYFLFFWCNYYILGGKSSHFWRFSWKKNCKRHINFKISNGSIERYSGAFLQNKLFKYLLVFPYEYNFFYNLPPYGPWQYLHKNIEYFPKIPVFSLYLFFFSKSFNWRFRHWFNNVVKNSIFGT